MNEFLHHSPETTREEKMEHLSPRERLEALREKSPGVQAIDQERFLFATFEEEDVKDSGFESLVNGYVSEQLERLSANDLSFSDRDELAMSLYGLFILNKQFPDAQGLDAFSRYEAFEKAFLSDSSEKERGAFKMMIQHAVAQQLRPESYVGGLIGNDRRFETVHGTDEWVLLPSKLDGAFSDNEAYYATPGVVREIVELLESGDTFTDPDYTHASGSEALASIADVGSILSARESMRRGLVVSTGESYSWAGEGSVNEAEDHPSWGMRPLRGIYTDQGGPRYGYNTVSWFDQFNVTFGIDGEKQKAFLAESDFGVDGEVLDLKVEGIVLGKEIPLENISVIYGESRAMEAVKKWQEQYAPHAQTMSLEASRVLKRHRKAVLELSKDEGVSEIDVWKSLLSPSV